MSISDKGWTRMVDDHINGKRMYAENRKSINWFVGCEFNCVYCKPSFQRQMKRQGKRCKDCYDYRPHTHHIRLVKPSPKTTGKDFVFFPSSGDVSFANPFNMGVAIEYTEENPQTTFLIQSKNPECFKPYTFPDNVILATTLETNLRVYNTPSLFRTYERISKAPTPIFRTNDFKDVKHKRKIVVVEPILDFDLTMLTAWIYRINPQIVYVGYDNHKCELPEPRLSKTVKLIEKLEKFTEVRVKTLRKAWWEGTP